jgi:D-alanine-D-alanine ligase
MIHCRIHVNIFFLKKSGAPLILNHYFKQLKKMKKLVGVLFGGKSTEHQISIISARNVYKNIDRSLYEPILMYIDPVGKWFRIREDQLLSDEIIPADIEGLIIDMQVNPIRFIVKKDNHKFLPDVIFPILHGKNGEDGNMQGFLNILNIPFVGPDMFASAACMDKEITKKLLEAVNIKGAKYHCYRKHEQKKIKYNKIIRELGLPLVIKPSRAGSSVGLSKADDENQFFAAIDLAFRYDTKIIIEKYIKGREIECAVLGNEEPIASITGEIITDFYDYEAKYLSTVKAKLQAPALIDKNTENRIRDIAIKAYKATECEGMSRIDFFLTPDDIILNEINTIPGFTDISMYPKLFELSGIPNKELISLLLQLAMKRFDNLQNLETLYIN